MSWWKKKKEVKEEKSTPDSGYITVPVPTSAPNANGVTFTAQPGTAMGTINAVLTGAGGAGNVGNGSTWYNITSAVAPAAAGNIYTAGTGFGNFTIGNYQPTNIISFSNAGGEVVRLNVDGSVTWKNGIDVDEAAEAFGKAMRLSSELQSGITKKVKAEMRDKVFEEIIEIAKTNGSLTVDELTFMYESSKIMEKLRGGRE